MCILFVVYLDMKKEGKLLVTIHRHISNIDLERWLLCVEERNGVVYVETKATFW